MCTIVWAASQVAEGFANTAAAAAAASTDQEEVGRLAGGFPAATRRQRYANTFLSLSLSSSQCRDIWFYKVVWQSAIFK